MSVFYKSGEKIYFVISRVWQRETPAFVKHAWEVWVHVITVVWEGCFTASAMPNRAVLKWCQTAWRAFAQTVTPLPLTTTDGVSNAYCVEGYVTSLRMPSCVLNLIWTTQAQMRTDTHTHMHEKTHTWRVKRGHCWINQAVSVENITIMVFLQ